MMITAFLRGLAATTLLALAIGQASAGSMGSFTSTQDSGHVQLNPGSGPIVQSRTYGAPRSWADTYYSFGTLGSSTSAGSPGY